MKKTKKLPLEEVDTKGFVLSGYVQSTNYIRARILNELSPTDYAVYITILAHRNTDEITAFPSVSLIARESGPGKRTVENAITRLVDKDYLLINSGRPGISNNYYFPLELFHEGHEKDMEVQMARRKYEGNQYEDKNKEKRENSLTKTK